MSDHKERPTFEFHFHDKVGQNIANVEHMEVHFDKDMQMHVANLEEVTDGGDDAETLSQPPSLASSNLIFNPRILTTEKHYHLVRDAIMKFIKKDGVASDTEQINPAVQSEWYFIMKGIRESGMASNSMGDMKFAEQMVVWLPECFEDKVDGDRKNFIRNLAKSISAERNNYWTQGAERREVLIIDMHAHARTRNIDSGKVKRAFLIAGDLCKVLEKLKTEIQKAQ